MSTLEQIEAAILKLHKNEIKQLKVWLSNLDYQQWDEQLEQDVTQDKLEDLATEAETDFDSHLVVVTQKLSEPTFNRVWDNSEDSVYDDL